MPLRHLPIFVLLSLFAACDSQPQENSDKITSADKHKQAVVYTAKSILSMDADRSIATAVAVEGDKIIAVGDVDSVQAALPDYQLELNSQFAEHVIMPGLIENHLHPTMAGILFPTHFITPFDWQLPGRDIAGVQGESEYRSRLIALEASLSDPNEFLISWGYHQYFHGVITRSDLDEISATRPMILWHRSFHEIVANTAALQALAISEAEFDAMPTVNYAEGHFWELGLFAIFQKLAPIILAPDRFAGGIRDGFVHAQMNGITTVADQGSPLFNMDLELSAINKTLTDEDMPLRMLMIGNGKTLALEGFDKGLENLESLHHLNTKRVKFLPKQVKLLADGAFYSQLMQMADGYLDGHHGEWIMPPEELSEAATTYWQAGYQLHIHVNGDVGVKVVLDMIEKLQQDSPRPDHQTVLHHYGYSGADQAERVAALGISVSANPFYLWALGDKYAEIGLGPERAHYITRLGDLERNGASVSFHSDLPMAPAAPLTLAGIAASRITAKGNLLAPEERMSIDAVLAGITIEAARAIQQQDQIGSIEVGKQADFTILKQSPLDVAPEKFRDIPIWGTVYGGEIHQRPE